MSLRHGVLSLLILLVIFFLVFENYETWTLPAKVLPEKEVTKKSVEKIDSSPIGIGSKAPADIQSYIFIAEKNIFHPERKEFPILPTPFPPGQGPHGQGPQPRVRPQVVLYGVTLAGDYQSASIVNPARPTKPGERAMMSVKVGDLIGEFKVAKILPDRITLEAGEDTFDVLLYTPKQRSYVKTETKPATITSTLPAPAAVPASGPAAAPRRTPLQQGQPIRERVVEAPIPRPVTPAPIPSSRTRRFYQPAPIAPNPIE